MPPEPEGGDQDLNLNPEGDNELEPQSPDQGGEGEGDEETPPPIKVGDKEYTPDQIMEMEKKASGYDPLLKEFTKKSQRLSELEKGQTKQPKQPDEDKPPYYDKDWAPKTYEELREAIIMAEERGEKRTLKKLQEMETEKQATAEEAEKIVDSFVTETKTKDNQFDEKDFFSFVDRHKLPIIDVASLHSAYSVYAEARNAGIKGGTDARRNIQTRGQDNISGPTTGKGKGFSVPWSKIRQAGSVYEAAIDAYRANK